MTADAREDTSPAMTISEQAKSLHIEIAEQIARDASCAQGEFNQRVLSIIPYLTDVCDRAERLILGVQRPEDVAREPMKIALTVLCAARSGQSWHENMLKDFDCAIYGLRVALESPHTGQPQEGGAMSDIQNQLRIAARESGRKSAFEEAARIAENFESDGNPFPTIQGAIAEAIRAGATLPAPQAGCAKEGDDRVSFPRWWIQHLYTGLNRINTASVPGEAGDFIFTLRHQLLDKLSETAPPVLVADKRTE